MEVGPEVKGCSGIKILETPMGNAEFVQRLSEERIGKEEHVEGDRLGSRSPVRRAKVGLYRPVSQLGLPDAMMRA